MRITFQAQGGIAFIPALSKPVEIATEQLPPDAGAKLEALVHAANFFSLPATIGKKIRGAADYRQYSITIADAGRSSTIQLIEPFENEALEELISALQSHARSQLLAAHKP